MQEEHRVRLAWAPAQSQCTAEYAPNCYLHPGFQLAPLLQELVRLTANFELVDKPNPPQDQVAESDSHVHGESGVSSADIGAVDEPSSDDSRISTAEELNTDADPSVQVVESPCSNCEAVNTIIRALSESILCTISTHRNCVFPLAVRLISAKTEHTETVHCCTEVTQYWRTSVAHLTLDGKLAFDVDLATPATEDGHSQAGDDEPRRHDDNGSKPDDHECSQFSNECEVCSDWAVDWVHLVFSL